jgi:hypothetical protein
MKVDFLLTLGLLVPPICMLHVMSQETGEVTETAGGMGKSGGFETCEEQDTCVDWHIEVGIIRWPNI